MNSQEPKIELIHWPSETTDENVLKNARAIRDASSYLTREQENILEERLERYDRGEMKFSSWEEVKRNILRN